MTVAIMAGPLSATISTISVNTRDTPLNSHTFLSISTVSRGSLGILAGNSNTFLRALSIRLPEERPDLRLPLLFLFCNLIPRITPYTGSLKPVSSYSHLRVLRNPL